jgi:hypothetical protein
LGVTDLLQALASTRIGVLGRELFFVDQIRFESDPPIEKVRRPGAY